MSANQRFCYTKKLLGITIDEDLNFGEHVTNVCKSGSRKLNALSRINLFFAINRKRLCQTLSSVDNSVIFLLFGCLILLGLTGKSRNYMRGLYDYAIMMAPRAKTNF